MSFTWTIIALVVVLAVAWRYLGSYMAAVFGGRVKWLAFMERPVYRILRIDPGSEQLGDESGRFLVSDPAAGYRLAASSG